MENANLKKVIDLIFKETLPTIDSILEKYPKRNLKEESMVTRFAPSPTGFLHIGGIYTALICERFAHQTLGVYFLRIEDTDQKRKIDEAENIISSGLDYFNLTPDEGLTNIGMNGEYGPYRQSERADIYRAFMKKLMQEGKVYPCFSTEDELEEMRKEQIGLSIRPGYYGKWAKWRDADWSIILEKIEKGEPYVLRFKSSGNPDKRIIISDLVKGNIEMPENDTDIIVMKGDGLPTYHFAHVVDDFLMHTTHVIRADEWFSSLPIHIELTEALGFPKMKYAHISPITKLDESGSKRKLSKRKDPEANVMYYIEKGYPKMAIIEYLMNLANSDFEDWRKANPEKQYTDFEITFKKLSQSNAPLLNEIKLKDISKEIISKMSVYEFYENVFVWSEKYDKEFNKKITDNKDYWIKIFSIERDGGKRKDISVWGEVFSFYKYFDNDNFVNPDWSIFNTPLSKEEIEKIKKETFNSLDNLNNKDEFMDFMRSIAKELGLASNIKEFKESNGKMRGHVGLVSQVIRFAITGEINTPDLFEIIEVLGKDEAKRRLSVV